MSMKIVPRVACFGLACLLLFSAPRAAAGQGARPALANEHVRAAFGARGLSAITDVALGVTWRLAEDGFALVVDAMAYDSAALGEPARRVESGKVVYTWKAGPHEVDVVYEVQKGWRFVSKQIVLRPAAGAVRVGEVGIFRVKLAAERPAEVYVRSSPRRNLGLGAYSACLRFANGAGLLVTAQNPFLEFTSNEGAFALAYRPDMDWAGEYGPFVSDRGLLAPYKLSGRKLPADMLPEWQMGTVDASDGMDEAEVDAFTRAVRAFLLYRPEKPSRVFVAWCVNDYQIDIATPEGREEYKRIIDRAAEMGAEHVLFAPTNSDLARREDSTDDWSWENLLWLGLGQKIRKGEWRPETGAVPPTVREMLDHAASRNVSLLAYVYPVLAFSASSEWLVTRPNDPQGRKYASLGFRSLQDWLITTLVAFHEKTGIAGYAFDHTFLNFDGPSAYAQWWGWRRVMETLRQRIPGIVIDGRQAYHLYGPWSWLAGTYPHPTYSDEQPESFVAFPDLSFDRVSAARQRYTAYRFRNYDFAPSEIVPGFITHQTGRNDDTGRMPQTKTERGILLDRFRPRDWDYLGWRYSLLSSIATAGWNNVINMIPARDLEEFRHFSDDDKAWFRRWLDWCDINKEFLRNTKTILGQPALGKVDGTAAIRGDRGYIFLFNPNARRLEAAFTLDESIGLEGKGPFVLREIHPLEGRAIGKPGAGLWARADRVSLTMAGHSAVVLEVSPAAVARAPLLFGVPGTVTITGGTVDISGAKGEIGTTANIMVTLPEGTDVSTLRVNGVQVAFSRPSPRILAAAVTFEGEAFPAANQVGRYDPAFAGGTFRGSFRVPKRVFDQLRARQEAWPIPWTPDDYRVTWLAPERLLLHVQIAEPNDTWTPRLRIDGRNIELEKAYTSVRAARRTFVGFYADVSLITPDRDYEVELDLPPLAPGQFQGLFFENIETEYTSSVRREGTDAAR